MDGAGRIARSIRSLRPKADLKAAAIGALILLREHVLTTFRASRGSLTGQQTPPRPIAAIERRLSRRRARAIYGAGRTVRSSPGPKADLKAAAIGALILLREHVLTA